jgi:hypothetical protein
MQVPQIVCPPAANSAFHSFCSSGVEVGSEIHTGPGRNIVCFEGGDDRMFIGNGPNHIAPGLDNAVFVVEYCGITEFETWDDTYVLDLSKRASAPTITKNDAGYTEVVLGVSIVRIHANIDSKMALVISVGVNRPKMSGKPNFGSSRAPNRF